VECQADILLLPNAPEAPQPTLVRAFQGKLVPIEADLARQEGRPCEPTSTLLAHIRAQRGQAAERYTTRWRKRANERNHIGGA
jgi:hypothetical protein